MLGRRLATTCALALVIGPTAATAQSPEQSRSREGIANARAAGMDVDPRVEFMMARAPLGSCANDPTLPSCPPAHAVRFAAPDGPVIGFASLDRREPLARATAFDCIVRVTAQSPYKAAGYAQMDSNNQCGFDVTRHELYARLVKYYAGDWHTMSIDVIAGIGGQTIYRSSRYRCTATPIRLWRAEADAYALKNGVWWDGSTFRQRELTCG